MNKNIFSGNVVGAVPFQLYAICRKLAYNRLVETIYLVTVALPNIVRFLCSKEASCIRARTIAVNSDMRVTQTLTAYSEAKK